MAGATGEKHLYDAKKAKDNADPHLVAYWDGFAPDSGRAHDFEAAKVQLVQALDLRVKQADRVAHGLMMPSRPGGRRRQLPGAGRASSPTGAGRGACPTGVG